MKRRIVSVVLIVAAVLCASLYQNTFAWFTKESYFSENFTVGDVSYTLEYTSTESAERGNILPGDEVLLGTFTLTNNSTIDTQIRFKVVDDISDNDAENFILAFNAPASGQSAWTFSKDDGYYYYGEPENGGNTISAATTGINFINSITYNGETLEKKDYSGASSTVTLMFQAKQAEYADWTDIGEFQI